MTFLLSSAENRNQITLPAKHVYPFEASGRANDLSKQVEFGIISFSLSCHLILGSSLLPAELVRHRAATDATYMICVAGGAGP